MKRLTILIIALAISACADMTPREKYWTAAAVGVLAAGAIAAHQEQNGHPISQPQCVRTSDGVPQQLC